MTTWTEQIKRMYEPTTSYTTSLHIISVGMY